MLASNDKEFFMEISSLNHLCKNLAKRQVNEDMYIDYWLHRGVGFVDLRKSI